MNLNALSRNVGHSAKVGSEKPLVSFPPKMAILPQTQLSFYPKVLYAGFRFSVRDTHNPSPTIPRTTPCALREGVKEGLHKQIKNRVVFFPPFVLRGPGRKSTRFIRNIAPYLVSNTPIRAIRKKRIFLF